MKVLLQRTWFAPMKSVKANKVYTVGGQRFKKGEQDIPAELIDFLPHDAVILDKKAKDPKPAAPAPSLKDFDDTRKAVEIEAEVREKAQKAQKGK